MSEKSGMEMLEEIIDGLYLLNRRFEVIEQTMKEVLNRMNGFQPTQSCEVVAKPTIASTVPVPTLPAGPVLGQPPVVNAGGTTKVMGKIKYENRSLIGVSVTIKNSQGEMVKETKTNRAGEWISFLPVGKYKAEYVLAGIINSSVNFQVSPGQTLLRVAQPKPQE